MLFIDNNEGERRINGACMLYASGKLQDEQCIPVVYFKDVLCFSIKGESDYLQLITRNWVNNK